MQQQVSHRSATGFQQSCISLCECPDLSIAEMSMQLNPPAMSFGASPVVACSTRANTPSGFAASSISGALGVAEGSACELEPEGTAGTAAEAVDAASRAPVADAARGRSLICPTDDWLTECANSPRGGECSEGLRAQRVMSAPVNSIHCISARVVPTVNPSLHSARSADRRFSRSHRQANRSSPASHAVASMLHACCRPAASCDA